MKNLMNYVNKFAEWMKLNQKQLIWKYGWKKILYIQEWRGCSLNEKPYYA